MPQQSVTQICFDFLSRLPIVVRSKEVSVSSDTGILPIRQFDGQLGFTERFIDCLNDPRDPALTRHTFAEMVRQRIYGIHAGYQDCNDHDTLRGDPDRAGGVGGGGVGGLGAEAADMGVRRVVPSTTPSELSGTSGFGGSGIGLRGNGERGMELGSRGCGDLGRVSGTAKSSERCPEDTEVVKDEGDKREGVGGGGSGADSQEP